MKHAIFFFVVLNYLVNSCLCKFKSDITKEILSNTAPTLIAEEAEISEKSLVYDQNTITSEARCDSCKFDTYDPRTEKHIFVNRHRRDIEMNKQIVGFSAKTINPSVREFVKKECEDLDASLIYDFNYICVERSICDQPNQPCANGGRCIRGKDRSSYTCRCSKEFEGKNCDIPIPIELTKWGNWNSWGKCVYPKKEDVCFRLPLKTSKRTCTNLPNIQICQGKSIRSKFCDIRTITEEAELIQLLLYNNASLTNDEKDKISYVHELDKCKDERNIESALPTLEELNLTDYDQSRFEISDNGMSAIEFDHTANIYKLTNKPIFLLTWYIFFWIWTATIQIFIITICGFKIYQSLERAIFEETLKIK